MFRTSGQRDSWLKNVSSETSEARLHDECHQPPLLETSDCGHHPDYDGVSNGENSPRYLQKELSRAVYRWADSTLCERTRLALDTQEVKANILDGGLRQ
jgi:hypothetical protein